MNKKDQQLIADMIAQSIKAIITAKKPTTDKKESKTEKIPLSVLKSQDSPPHKKSDIPQLINTMSKEKCVELFGDITTRAPYEMDISKFYKEYNIQLDPENKYDRKNLTLENKHLVIQKQLSGASKKVMTAQKQRYLTHITEKIKNPPTHNLFHRELTDRNVENIVANWTKEQKRWESD